MDIYKPTHLPLIKIYLKICYSKVWKKLKNSMNLETLMQKKSFEAWIVSAADFCANYLLKYMILASLFPPFWRLVLQFVHVDI